MSCVHGCITTVFFLQMETQDSVSHREAWESYDCKLNMCLGQGCSPLLCIEVTDLKVVECEV